MPEIRDFVFYGDKTWFCSIEKDGKLTVYGNSNEQEKEKVKEQIRKAFRDVREWDASAER